jgi:hypothetical protein
VFRNEKQEIILQLSKINTSYFPPNFLGKVFRKYNKKLLKIDGFVSGKYKTYFIKKRVVEIEKLFIDEMIRSL